jgi:hypothetical protein
VPAHADDERHGEFLAVGIVQAVELREFRLRQAVEAGARLLGPGAGGELPPARGLAREIGMRLDQVQPSIRRRAVHCAGHRFVQRGEGAEWALGAHRLRHPRRMLVDIAQRGDEARRVGRVELIERNGRHGGIALFRWSMIFSENRYPLFGIML